MKPNGPRSVVKIALVGLVMCFGSQSIPAQTWNGGGGDNLWSNGANWGGVAPVNNGTANIAFGGTTRLNPDMDANWSILSLTFNSGAGAFNLTSAGGFTLTLQGGGITNNSTSTQTISTAITLGQNQTWNAASGNLIFAGNINNNNKLLTIDGANNTTISGIISGNAGLTKNGTGTLILSGANTFANNTTVNAGAVNVRNSSAFGVSGNSVSVASGAAVQLQSGVSIANDITINGNGVSNDGALRNLSGTNTLSGKVTVNSNAYIGADAGTLNLTGQLVGNKTLNFVGNGTVVLGGSVSNTYNGAATVSSGTLLLSKTGGAVALGGALTIGTGSGSALVQYTADNQLPGGVINLTSSGTLDLNGFNETSNAGLTFTGGSVTTGAGVLTFSGATANITTNASSSTATIGGNLALGGANRIFTVASGTTASGTDLSISAAISGNRSITKAGTGLLSLSGTNTYTGGTNFNAGTLNVGSAGALGSSGTLSFGGGTLQYSASNTTDYSSRFSTANNQAYSIDTNGQNVSFATALTSSAATLSKLGSGTLTLNGANTYTGTTTISGGTLRAGVATVGTTSGAFGVNSAVTLANTAGAILDLNGFNNTIGSLTGGGASGGDITLGSATLTVGSNNTSPGAYAGAISGTGGLTKTGTGTLTLAGASSYSGATNVNAGILNIQSASALGSTAGGTTVASSATLQLQNNITVGAESLTISGTGASGQNGSLVNVSGTNNYGGLLTLGAASTISSDGGTLNLTNTGTITGTGLGLTLTGSGDGSIVSNIGTGSGTVTKTGSGTWTLSGNNTYTGGTNINAGTLSVGSAGALGSSGTISFGGGALQYNVGITTDYSSRFSTANNQNYRIDTNGQNVTFAGSMTSSGGTLTKLGSGTLTLNAANTYTGATTISAGAINVQNATALGTTAGGTTVSSGAALQVQGGIAFGTEALTLNGDGIASDGALRNISGANSWAGSITLASDSTIQSDANTLTLSGAINTGSFVLTMGGAGNVTTSGVIGGTGGLTKTGTGTLTLTGANNNSYTGVTTVADGTLQLNMTAGKSAFNGTLTVGDGTGAANSAVVRFLADNQIPNKGITINTDGLLDLNNFVDAIGGLTMTGGNVTTGTGTLTLGGNVTGNAAATSATISGNLALGGNRTFSIADGAATQDMNISAVVSGGASTVTKDGAGTLVFSGANTYTGKTTISAGTLQFAKEVSLYNNNTASWTAANIIVASGATAAFNIGGTGEFTSGDLDILKALGTGTGGFANGSFLGLDTTNASSGTFTYSSVIANPNAGANVLGLTKLGSGTLVLSAANTYTGLTTVTAGTLSEGVSNAISTGGLTVNGATAVFDLGANHSDSVGTVTLDGGGSITGTGTSALTSTGSFEMKSGSASAVLAGSGIALNKTTSGTVTLTGANTYTGGTNVSGGSLLANNTSGSATGTGAVSVTNSGSLLGGNGTITGAVSMASGTNLAPGATTATGSTAVLKTGALTLSSGSNFTVDLNGTTAGTGYDQVRVTGAVGITGSNIVVNPGAGLNVGDKFFVLLNDASDSISGTFAQGSTITVGGDTFSINYLDNGDGGGNDISLTLVAVIPEPATWVGAALTLGILAWSQRRRLSPNRITAATDARHCG